MNKLDLDRLRVLFKETWFFIDDEEKQILPDNTILFIEMEHQLNQEEYEALKELEQTIDNAMTAGGVLTLAVNLCLAFALKYLWKMINLFSQQGD